MRFQLPLLLSALVYTSLGQEETPQPGDQLWSFQMTDQVTNLDRFTEPAIGPDGTVYVGHNPSPSATEGTLYAINPDGTLRWSEVVPFSADYWGSGKMRGFRTPAVAPDGNIVFPCGAALYSYSPDGERRWMRTLPYRDPRYGSASPTPPIISADGKIYCGEATSGMHRIDPETGAILWQFGYVEGEVDFTGAGVGALTVGGTVLFFANSIHPIWELNPDGSLARPSTFGPGATNYFNLPPAVSSTGRIVTAGRPYNRDSFYHVVEPGGSVVGFDRPPANYPGTSIPPVIGPNQELVFTDMNGTLRCLSERLTLQWALEGFADQAPLLAADDTIFAVTGDPASPAIKVLSLAGVEQYEIKNRMRDPAPISLAYVGDSVGYAPIIAPLARLTLSPDGVLYAVPNNGKLYAFHAGTSISSSDWPKAYGGIANASRVTHLAPEIDVQPQGGLAISHGSYSLQVEAHGRPAPDYQWHFGDDPVPGATESELRFSAIQASDMGDYRVEVSNSEGTVTSETVSIEVQHELDLNQRAGGTIHADPEGPLFADGAMVTVTATPATGWIFAGWQQTGVGDANPLVLELTESVALTPRFHDQRRSLSLDASGLGEITSDPAGPVHLLGEEVILTATAGPGHVFSGWEGAVVGEENPVTLTISADHRVTARFTDIEEPSLGLDGEFPRVVADPRFVLVGTADDNAGVARASYSLNGAGSQDLTLGEGGHFSEEMELSLGLNTILLELVDANDLETSRIIEVEWAPDRLWTLEAPEVVREAETLEVSVGLVQPGDVAGANIMLHVDPTFLEFLEFEEQNLPTGSFSSVSESQGVLSFNFASLSRELPAGETEVGRVRYRVRSLPETRPVTLRLEQLDLADLGGNPIAELSGIRNAEVRLQAREIVGDVNNNGRYDTGDAQVLQRLLAGSEEFRDWDDAVNDVNGSGVLDIGDVIRVLRTAARLEEQPGNGLRTASSSEIVPEFSSFDPVAATARLVVDRQHAGAGETLLVQVVLDHVPADFGGASFVLDYPVDALRLEDADAHRSGPLQPGEALEIWNLAPGQYDYGNQSGSVAFAAGSPTDWPGSGAGGVVAEFEFTVQAGASDEQAWPLVLRELELSTDEGYRVLATNSLDETFAGIAKDWAAWLGLHFPAELLGDPEITGAAADPDGDRMANLVEFWGGSDPLVGSASPLEQMPLHFADGSTGQGWRFRFDPTAVDLEQRLQWSDDLSSWNDVAADGLDPLFREIERSFDPESGLVTRTFLELGERPSGRFLRLEVESEP